MINIDGIEYAIRQPTDAEQAWWEYVCLQELQKLYNPIEEFSKTLPECKWTGFAISGFIASRQNLEYPTYYKLLADNSLISVKALVEMTTNCDPNLITEENKYDVLNQIKIFWYDTELAKILEIERSRNGTTSTSVS